MDQVENPKFFGEIAIAFRATALRVKSDFDGETQWIFVAGEATDIREIE